MVKLHIKKESFDGYCVGQGVEYSGIIVHAKTDDELKEEFLKILPGHKAVLKQRSQEKNVTVLEIDEI